MVGGKGYRRQNKAAHIERKRPKSPRNHTAGSSFGRFCVSEANRQLGSDKEVSAMPRMPKYLKREWAFFLDERGRKKYNELCRKCERSCKQSFRATVIQCPHYLSKRRTRQRQTIRTSKPGRVACLFCVLVCRPERLYSEWSHSEIFSLFGRCEVV